MLTGDQVEALSLRAEEISDKLSDFLIKDIAERVSEAGQLTSTASYEVWRLQNLGVSQEKLKKELKKRLNISLSQVEDLLKQSAEAGYNFDISNFPTDKAIPFAENTTLQQIVGASVQMAQEDFTNIVQTIGFVGPEGNVQELTQAYQGACDYAFQKTVTGTQDMQSAIREATKNLAEKGIRYIDYESGVHTSMEAAVRRCVMGGMGLMQEKISESNHDYLGCDGWEISAHHGSAPDHEPIQGKQYTDKEYKTINGSLLRRIGTLNCGHAAFPIIMGVNSPQYTAKQLEDMRQENEEGVTYGDRHYTLYEATQRQRQYERTIRKQKRRILVDEATGDKDKLQNDQIRLQLLKQEYAKFSKGTGLRPQYDRMETAGFDWKKGKAAEKTVGGNVQKATSPLAKAYSDGENKIKWPNKGAGITAEQYKNLRGYAEQKNIILQGFKNSDVALDLARDTIDETEHMLDLYPELRGSGKKLFTLNLDRHMDSIDFAEVREGSPHIMHINADAYRSRESLAQEYEKLAESGWFVRGTSYRSIVHHEVGHMVSEVYGIDGLSLMKEVLGTDSTAETLLWCKNNLSEYSFKSDGSEIISEMFSAYYGLEKPSKETIDFMTRCGKIITDRRGAR